MSGCAHQRRKARRAASRLPAPPAPPVIVANRDDETASLPVQPPSWEELPAPRWVVVVGIGAFAVMLAGFIAWLCTLPRTR